MTAVIFKTVASGALTNAVIPGTTNLYQSQASGSFSKQWFPQDITQCLVSIMLTAGITQVANKISQATDQSTSGNNATEAVGARQPDYVNPGLNGQPICRSNGVASGLGFAGIVLGATNTFFGVFTPSTSINGYLFASTTNNTGFISNFAGVAFEWLNLPDRYTLSAGAAGAHALMVTQDDAGNVSGYLDGTQIFTHAVGAPLAGITVKQLQRTAALNSSTSDMGQFQGYSKVLNANERGLISQFARNIWATP